MRWRARQWTLLIQYRNMSDSKSGRREPQAWKGRGLNTGLNCLFSISLSQSSFFSLIFQGNTWHFIIPWLQQCLWVVTAFFPKSIATWLTERQRMCVTLQSAWIWYLQESKQRQTKNTVYFKCIFAMTKLRFFFFSKLKVEKENLFSIPCSKLYIYVYWIQTISIWFLCSTCEMCTYSDRYV